MRVYETEMFIEWFYKYNRLGYPIILQIKEDMQVHRTWEIWATCERFRPQNVHVLQEIRHFKVSKQYFMT